MTDVAMHVRAYSRLEITKAVEEDGKRILRGVATTPAVDRVDDTINPLGVKFAESMPFLWQHRHDQPCGWTSFGKPTKSGIPFETEIAQTDEPGVLKDFLDSCWQQLKLRLVRAVSIGFRPIKWAWMDNGGIEYQEIECFELSAVTIPANPEAVINEISGAKGGAELALVLKNLDLGAPAASGRPTPPDEPKPGASGMRTAVKAITRDSPKEGAMNKTIAEQISAFEATRAAKSARMTELMEKAAEEGATLDADQAEEYDTLEAEVKQVDEHLKRLAALDATNKAKATVVTDAKSADDASKLRASYGSVSVAKRPLEKGILFTRFIGAKLLARQLMMPAWEIAARKWGNESPELEMMLKAAVVPGSTYDSTFAEPLVQIRQATGEFIELLTSKQIIGRIPGLDQVDFNVEIPRGTGDPTGYWVGEGDNIPLSRSAFDSVTLTFAKVAAIVPMTKDLLQFSTPKAEIKVRDGLIRALAYRADRDFLDPTKAVTTGVSPASITNGVTPTTASGSTADAFRDDLGSMLEDLLEANEDPDGIVLVMTPMQAMRLGLMRNSLGGKEFPDISKAGGVIEGFPVITSTNIVATGGSPTDGYPIVGVNAPNVMVAQEGVTVDMSDQASLQMSDSPDSPETASTVSVSLWQREMVALKAVQHLTWAKAHSTSVQFIQNGKYQ